MTASCGLLQPPMAALAELAQRLESAPPALPVAGGPELKLSKLHLEPPRLAPEERGSVRVDAVIWAEGQVGGARLVFHGPDELALSRASVFARWQLDPALPNLRSIAALLARRQAPLPVAAWAVGLTDQREAEIREEYARDGAGRPVRAAQRLFARRAARGEPWELSR